MINYETETEKICIMQVCLSTIAAALYIIEYIIDLVIKAYRVLSV